MKTYPALILVKIEESEVGLTAWDSEGRYIVVQSDQIAPTDADTVALIEEAKSYIGTNWDFGYPDGVMQRMVNALSRPVQPVRVEVTDEMVRAIKEHRWNPRTRGCACGWRFGSEDAFIEHALSVALRGHSIPAQPVQVEVTDDKGCQHPTARVKFDGGNRSVVCNDCARIITHVSGPVSATGEAEPARATRDECIAFAREFYPDFETWDLDDPQAKSQLEIVGQALEAMRGVTP